MSDAKQSPIESPNESPEKRDSGAEKRGFRLTRIVILFALCLGLFSGLGMFTFGYGQGGSYFSNDPNACANCHAMDDHLDSWQKSSHHHVAVCNDCHLPHDPVVKWITKADNGFFHSWAFTFGNYHQPIQIKARNRRITQQTCIDCHHDLIHPMLPAEGDEAMPASESMLSCVHCHGSVGHAFRPQSSQSERE